MTYPVAKLGDVAEFIRGITFKPDDVVPVDADDAVVCMRTKNVQTLLDCDDLLAVPSQFVRRKDQYLEEGDILVSSANSWNLVGKCCWIPSLPWRAAFGGFISVLRGDSTRVDRRYLYWWFASDRTQALLRSFGQKTTNISNLNIDRCRQLDLPLPPLPEQRRIAAILDKADALRTKRREALAQLDRLAQSIFVEMFGDPVKGDGRFPVATVESIAANQKYSIVDGPFGSSMKPDDYQDSGIPVIRIANITKEGEFTSEKLLFIGRSLFEKLSRSSVKPRDVLVSRVGTIGNTCLFPEGVGDALLSTTGVCKITVDESRVLPEFLHRCFLHPNFQKQIHQSASTSVQKYFNLTALKGWSVVVPPMSEQTRFVERLTALQAKRAKHSASLQELDALFSALQHRAFRGDL